MHEKKRKAFLTWRREKVESAAISDFQKKLSAYLKSDVQVLKEACLTFVKEMRTDGAESINTVCHRCQPCFPCVAKIVFGRRFDCLGTEKWLAEEAAESE